VAHNRNRWQVAVNVGRIFRVASRVPRNAGSFLTEEVLSFEESHGSIWLYILPEGSHCLTFTVIKYVILAFHTRVEVSLSPGARWHDRVNPIYEPIQCSVWYMEFGI
jgi:hypothetical protein